MRFVIVKKDQLPLGWRILRFGCTGRDVAELQNRLFQAGFYFGGQDGIFDVLTGEAVTLLQRTFHLRVDGVAGPQVLGLLGENAANQRRIIYQVKKNEELGGISERFEVKRSAWRRIPGQGNPHRRIYPGLRMVLNQKAVFCWENPETDFNTPLMTGFLYSDYQLKPDGELKPAYARELIEKKTKLQNCYHLIGVQRDVWMKILSSPKIWPRLGEGLKEIGDIKFGLDFREAPLDKMNRWKDLVKFICNYLRQPKLSFLLLPLWGMEAPKMENRLYWLNLPAICAWAKFVMIEPKYNMKNPLLFETSAANIFKELRHLGEAGLAERSFIVSTTAGWDWNMDQNQRKKLSYRVAKLIQAQHSQSLQYSPSCKCNVIHYFKNHEHHCFIYRDEQCWRDFFNKIIDLNLAGAVIAGFKELGKAGAELIAGSFKLESSSNFESAIQSQCNL
jgi:Putative peptidoglycan-binding domain-containing protein